MVVKIKTTSNDITPLEIEMATTSARQYPAQLNAKLGPDYNQALRDLADQAGTTLADYLRAVTEVLAQDQPLRGVMARRAHHLQGPPGQQ